MDTWQGKASNPTTLNKYLYADANPVMYVDPTGHFTLAGIMAGINSRANLGTLNTASARMALERFLVGNVSRSTGTSVASHNGSLGLIGNLIREEMKEAVIDTLLDYAIQGIDPFSDKRVFGTKAHSNLEERIDKLNKTLDKKFNKTQRWGLTVKAEAFFDRGSGAGTSRRAKGSFGIDVTIMDRNKKVLRSFDLKTGGGWSKKESKFRAGNMGSDLFQIYVVPKK